jgi:hypothetical protein
MSNLELWAIVVGTISPLVIAVIQQRNWASHVKAVVTVVAAIVIGLGNVYFNGMFNLTDMAKSILLVFVATIVTYQGFWKPVGVAPAIESATSTNKP